jgi:hypothetical protein
MVDTGAETSLIHPEIAERFKIKPIESSGPAFGANGNKITVVGDGEAEIEFQECKGIIRFKIIEHAVCDVILGNDMLRFFRCVVDYDNMHVVARRVNITPEGPDPVPPVPGKR